jgi:hypothetical protein
MGECLEVILWILCETSFELRVANDSLNPTVQVGHHRTGLLTSTDGGPATDEKEMTCTIYPLKEPQRNER